MMYGKIFTTIYDGTLYGQWQAIVTMQQLIVLCDADGVVDMTPPAIAARTSIPLKIIEKGLEILSQPDPYSRTAGSEGRRIDLIDDHRPWGWIIVNHAKYREIESAEKVREQTRERVRKHRENKRQAAENEGGNEPVTDGNASNGIQIQIHIQDPPLVPPEIPDWIPPDAWARWDQHCREKRKPLKKSTIRAQVKKLEQYRQQGHDPEDVIENSIAGNYQGLYPENGNGKGRGKTGSNSRPLSAVERVRRANGLNPDGSPHGATVDPDDGNVRLQMAKRLR